jgi:hypothetical protein
MVLMAVRLLQIAVRVGCLVGLCLFLAVRERICALPVLERHADEKSAAGDGSSDSEESPPTPEPLSLASIFPQPMPPRWRPPTLVRIRQPGPWASGSGDDTGWTGASGFAANDARNDLQRCGSLRPINLIPVRARSDAPRPCALLVVIVPNGPPIA